MTKKKIDFKRLTPMRLGDEVLRIQRRYTYRFRIRRKFRRLLVKLRRVRRIFVGQMNDPSLMDRADLTIHSRPPYRRMFPSFLRRIFRRRRKRQ